MGRPWRRGGAAVVTYEYSPLPSFTERRPGIRIPHGYRPTAWEVPASEVVTPDEAAIDYMRCARSLPHFAFRVCWSLHTDDPGGTPVYRKFPTYPYLIDFFTRTQEPSNIHIEKSRQLLMSWAWMAVFLWDILFHDAWANLAVSRQETLVDDGAANATTDSLFGKLLVIWRSLPPYLQHPMEFRHLRIFCPATMSYVKGVSGQSHGGRGATYKRALLDEAAHIANGESLFRAVHESAKNGLALNSTPMGKGNMFARIRFQPRTTFTRVSYHWTMHPEKSKEIYCTCGWHSDVALLTETMTWRQQYLDHVCHKSDDPNEKMVRHPRSPWYDHATADYTPEQIASEFDLSYEKSMRGRVFEPFDESRHVVDYQDVVGVRQDGESARAYRERYLRSMLKPNLVTVCGWDFGVGDPTSLLLGQVIDDYRMKIRWLDEYEMNGQSWRHFRVFVNGLWAPIVKEVTGFDLLHYGDPSGKNRQSDLRSWVSNLAREHDPDAPGLDLGPPIIIKTGPMLGGILEWLDLLADLFRRNVTEVSLWCSHLIDVFGNYHFPLDSNGEPVPGSHLPVHDQWSHAASVYRYVYEIRWPGRLHDVDAVQVTAGAILAMSSEDSREQPPMF